MSGVVNFAGTVSIAQWICAERRLARKKVAFGRVLGSKSGGVRNMGVVASLQAAAGSGALYCLLPLSTALRKKANYGAGVDAIKRSNIATAAVVPNLAGELKDGD
jgi:hypothetical protein